MKLNKKAQEEGLELIFVSIFIIVLLVVFVMTFGVYDLFSGDREIILLQSEVNEDSLFLMNLLRTNTTYNQNNIKIFQLINIKDKNEIGKNIKEILSNYCQNKQDSFGKNKCSWELTIKYNNEEFKFQEKTLSSNFLTSTIKFKDQNNKDTELILKKSYI